MPLIEPIRHPWPAGGLRADPMPQRLQPGMLHANRSRYGVNAGLVALAANLAAVAAVSAVRPAHTPEDRIAQPELSRAYR